MTLPDQVRREVEVALTARAGRRTTLAAATPVGGGCVSPVARLETDGGERIFLKWSAADHPAGLLAAEARGLRALHASRTVRVPALVGVPGDQPEQETEPAADWLLLEWIDPGPARPEHWTRLGADLAGLHRHAATAFGAEAPNFIGPLPQSNTESPSWPDFWGERRLAPQLNRAAEARRIPPDMMARFDRLLAVLGDRIGVGDAEGPSLLHGDLWSGNVHMPAVGPPAVIDPSVYFGHREVDLAMAALFGGFGSGFREAYEEVWPLEPGFEPVRRAVYQLYYLLVHVNLFGGSYLEGCGRALAEAGV